MKKLTKTDWKKYNILVAKSFANHKPLSKEDYEKYFQIFEDYHNTYKESGLNSFSNKSKLQSLDQQTIY